MAEKEIKATEKAGFDFTKLNTLSVVSLATSVTGFGALAGVITGHIALSQIKKSNEGGRPMAIAGLVVGYAFLGLAIAGTVVRVVMAARHGVPYGDDMMGGFGNQGDHRGGLVHNFGGPEGIQGGMPDDQGDMRGGPEGHGGMWVGPGGMNPDDSQLPPVDQPSPTPATK